jgi:hypothetical protein
MRGRRERSLVESDGQKVTLVIRRLFCDKCKRIHHELPDCIVPYKRHCAETIEKATQGGEAAKTAAICDRTIRRIRAWWAAVLPYFLYILKSLTVKHRIQFDNPPAFKEIVRAVVNSNGWIFARPICTRSVSLSEQGA